MTISYNMIEADRVEAELQRKRSLELHAQLMHLPAEEGLLQRLLRRLREAGSGGDTLSPASAVQVRKNKTDSPPAFSR